MSDYDVLRQIANDGRAHLRPRIEVDDVGGGLGAIPDYPVQALPVAARSLVGCGAEAGLPVALLGGAVLAAMAAAVGKGAQLRVTPTWHERAILWIALLAPRGAGKSPSQDLALEPLRDHDAQLDEEADEGDEVLFGDTTLEALARSLHAARGAGAVDLDELAVLLRGMGEYKRSSGGDRGRFLALWSGAPWKLTRVGGGDKTNKVRLRIPRPTLSIVGGLQPELHELLGGEEDGLRPRWLPHYAELPDEEGDLGHARRPHDWQLLLGQHLLPRRHDERTWRLDEAGLAAFESHRKRWKRQARGFESASTSAALVKADVHLARVALVLAESGGPARGGDVGASVVHRAAAIVNYTLDCWRALPEQGGLALSTRDWRLDQHLGRLVAWLEQHGGEASRRELQRAHAAGVRTAADLEALLGRYEQRFPGHVTEDTPSAGGLATVLVRAPKRVPSTNGVATGDTDIQTDENGRSRAKSDRVATGDTESGDTGSGDTAPAGCPSHPDGARSGCRYCAGAAA